MSHGLVGLDHVAFIGSDHAMSKRFCIEALGLEVIREIYRAVCSRGRSLDVAGQALFFPVLPTRAVDPGKHTVSTI